MSKLRTTTKYKDGDSLPPIHPGEILKSEFMEPLNLSATQLALHMGIPLSRIIMIVGGKRNLTADTAFRLAKVFKTTPDFWLNLQSQYEVSMLAYSGAAEKICLEVREIESLGGLHRRD
ncbi:MAG: HigA family addiction module antidote protein [Candidatus Obscuribacterales bacterium]|nr:HigA family addiction module antidote protein [Candidatus Obscuribacterales bacterium]